MFEILKKMLRLEIVRGLRFIKIFLIKLRFVKTISYKRGFCNCCGKTSAFYTRNSKETFNNSNICTNCGSNARFRLISLLLANELLKRDHLDKKICLNDIAQNRAIKILDTSYKSPLYSRLKNKVELTMSEYFPNLKKGIAFFSLENQDLKELIYDDNELDVIITSEVFEHLDNPWFAFSEVNRVLKPNGVHIFTVPFYENLPSITKAQVNKNGEIEYFGKKEYHIDPLSKHGSLVFTKFGNNLPDKLKSLGFETDFIKISDDNLIFKDTYALISRKIPINR